MVLHADGVELALIDLVIYILMVVGLIGVEQC